MNCKIVKNLEHLNHVSVNKKKCQVNSQYVLVHKVLFKCEHSDQLEHDEISMSNMDYNLVFKGQDSTDALIEEFSCTSNHQVLQEIKCVLHLNGPERYKFIYSQDFLSYFKHHFQLANHTQHYQFQFDGTQFDIEVLTTHQQYGFIEDTTNITLIKGMHQNIEICLDKHVIHPDIIRKSGKHMYEALKQTIGGHNKSIEDICKRIFQSRRMNQDIFDSFGLKHTRGLILYGPPGTGKTLIARGIAKVASSNSIITIINGPEIKDKFVGESEKKIREPFERAMKEQIEKGNKSELHIIIFDEIDALCKKRGASNSSSDVGDSIVNQLLTCIDGVKPPNNILVIGMTNRIDLIDPAMCRPGRLEVHVEINLPDLQGRIDILTIHAKKMIEKHCIEQMDFQGLAEKTQNYTGAELESLVKNAYTLAYDEWETNSNFRDEDIGIKYRIERQHFLRAIEQTSPQFGYDLGLISKIIPKHLYNLSASFAETQTKLLRLKKYLRNAKKGKFLILFNGPQGVGKTTQAALLAKEIECSFTKLVSSEKFIGISQSEKCNILVQIFLDAQKSDDSCILLDDLVRLVEYIPMGDKFNNSLLQNLINLLIRPYDEKKKMVIIATSTKQNCINQLGLTSLFEYMYVIDYINSVEVPCLNSEDVEHILKNKKASTPLIETFKKKNNLTIKTILAVEPMEEEGGEYEAQQKFYW